MATVKFYLDTRATGLDKPAPLKITIRHHNSAILLTTGVSLLPEQWDNITQRVVNHPRKVAFNNMLAHRLLDVETEVLRLVEAGALSHMKSHALRKALMQHIDPQPEADNANLFVARFQRFAARKTNARTRELYEATLSRIRAYDKRCERLAFEDVDKYWLSEFDAFLAKTSPSVNARAIHMRNIRAVFNDAIDDEVTRAYPFRKFTIKYEPTAKRSVDVDTLRAFFTCEVEQGLTKYQDMAKLIFFFQGINVVDLCHLSAVNEGYIEFYRRKTKRLYRIKVEPEAHAIIERYRGEGQLLNILDRYDDYRDYNRRLNEGLRKIGTLDVGRYNRKTRSVLCPKITTYWLRHSWATIAASLDIPKETIAAALGHGGNTITDVYIDFDRSKIDEANRRVIDWVLYGKK